MTRQGRWRSFEHWERGRATSGTCSATHAQYGLTRAGATAVRGTRCFSGNGMAIGATRRRATRTRGRYCIPRASTV
eukprot:10235521-Alexandrium_andersonii.AAC.1